MFLIIEDIKSFIQNIFLFEDINMLDECNASEKSSYWSYHIIYDSTLLILEVILNNSYKDVRRESIHFICNIANDKKNKIMWAIAYLELAINETTSTRFEFTINITSFCSVCYLIYCCILDNILIAKK